MKSLLFVHHNSSHKAKQKKKGHQRQWFNTFNCFSNKSNLLCTSTEPQQRSKGRSWPQSLQMDAECFRVTVNCILNTVYSKAQGAEWGHFNRLPPPSHAGGWVYSSGLIQCVSQRSRSDSISFILSSHNPDPYFSSVLQSVLDKQTMWEYFAFYVKHLVPWCQWHAGGESKHPCDTINLCMLTSLEHWVTWNTFRPERPTAGEERGREGAIWDDQSKQRNSCETPN